MVYNISPFVIIITQVLLNLGLLVLADHVHLDQRAVEILDRVLVVLLRVLLLVLQEVVLLLPQHPVPIG